MHKDEINARYKLKSGVSISIKTVMIGALAIIEEHFKEEIEKDPERWEEVRQEILARGHESLDIAMNHFNRYNISFKNFSGDFRNGKYTV